MDGLSCEGLCLVQGIEGDVLGRDVLTCDGTCHQDVLLLVAEDDDVSVEDGGTGLMDGPDLADLKDDIGFVPDDRDGTACRGLGIFLGGSC